MNITRLSLLIACSLMANLQAAEISKNSKILPKLTIPYTTEKVTIDGVLDDPAWEKAISFNKFLQAGKQDASDSKTEVYAFIQDDCLYVGFVAYDDNMANVRESIKKNSIQIYRDESVFTFLSADRQGYSQFIASAGGYKGAEPKTGSASNFRDNWYKIKKKNIDFQVKVKKYKDKWVAEKKIKLAQIFDSYPAKGEKIKLYLNFCRNNPKGKGNYSCIAALPKRGFHQPQYFIPVTLDWDFSGVALRNKKFNPDRLEKLTFTQQLKFPELLIAGKPHTLDVVPGKFTPLPNKLIFVEQGVKLSKTVKGFIRKGVCLDGGTRELKVLCRVVKPDAKNIDKRLKALFKKSSEAFSLKISKNSVEVVATHRQGVLQGLATFALLASRRANLKEHSLPLLTLLDLPGLRHRSHQVNSSITRPDQIKKIIPVLYLLRYNTVFFNVSVYHGQVHFPFTSHPDLSDKKYTKQDWKDLADYCRDFGLTPVPRYNSWSRAGYVLNRPEYMHLAENTKKIGGTKYTKRWIDKNFCAANPAALKFLEDLWTEMIDAMKVSDFHIGQDEVHYDDLNTNPLSKAKGWKPSDWFIHSTILANDFMKKKNVKMWIWADNLDPEQHGHELDMSGVPLLKQLPKDIVLMDWKYNSRYDHVDSLPSIKLFVDQGFDTVGCSKFTANNVALITREVYQNNAYGVCLTSWGESVFDNKLPYLYALHDEAAQAMGYGAYLAYSPTATDLSKFPYMPSALFKQTAHYYGKNYTYSANSKPVIIKDKALLTAGAELAKKLNMPSNSTLSMLNNSVTDFRGVKLTPFIKNSLPAAITVKGKSRKTVTIPLNAQVKNITFLHTINKQPIAYLKKVIYRYKKFNRDNTSCAKYIIKYADGSKITVPIRYRSQLNDWNAIATPCNADPALFGIANNRYQVSIPTYCWRNPTPDKKIKSIELKSGSDKNMTYALFALNYE